LVSSWSEGSASGKLILGIFLIIERLNRSLETDIGFSFNHWELKDWIAECELISVVFQSLNHWKLKG
jgi:hypothetical protein